MTTVDSLVARNPQSSLDLLAQVALEASQETIDLACRIAETPAPTNDEGLRTELLMELMPQLGFSNVQADDLGNVVGTIQCETAGPSLLVAAHIDTVFSMETPIEIVRTADTVAAPGIGDNSLGVAAALMLPTILKRAGIPNRATIKVTGNVGEEGLGDLRGIRRILDADPEIGAVVALEGHNLGRVTNVAVGSRRLRVTVQGPGGHSWGDAGLPSAIHAAAELITQLARIRLNSKPKTTLNVGLIEGGISVNTIAPVATFVVDLRSTDEAALVALEQRVREILERPAKGMRVDIEVLGDRPAGQIPADSPIIRHAWEVLRELGVDPILDASSTDANIPISRGIPAVCIGLTTGGNVHRVDEFINTESIAAGLYQMAALALRLTDDLAVD